MTNFENLYQQIDIIDAHIHQNVNRPAILDEAVKEGFRSILIFLNLTVRRNRERLECGKRSPGILNFMATFPSKGLEASDWQENALN